MRVIDITAFGPADVLQPADRPSPPLGPGEVRIAIAAAGVNRPDIMQRQGLYPAPKGATDIPGLECAGTITEVSGHAMSATGRVWRAGDTVCALLPGGGYADEAVVSGLACLPIPDGLSMVEASALPETFFTVWTNVVDRGRLQPGEWLLVHGGTSGIGTTAIQIATVRGARVIATAGSDEKCRACERLGAVAAINYGTEDFVERVKTITGGRGVDVVLDIVGGSYTAKNILSLAREGRLVQIGMMGGTTADIPLGPIILKRLTFTGSTLRIRTSEEKGAIAAALEREVWPVIASGRIRPVVHRTFPLDHAADAHRALESGHTIGKIVLTV